MDPRLWALILPLPSASTLTLMSRDPPNPTSGSGSNSPACPRLLYFHSSLNHMVPLAVLHSPNKTGSRNTGLPQPQHLADSCRLLGARETADFLNERHCLLHCVGRHSCPWDRLTVVSLSCRGLGVGGGGVDRNQTCPRWAFLLHTGSCGVVVSTASSTWGTGLTHSCPWRMRFTPGHPPPLPQASFSIS